MDSAARGPHAPVGNPFPSAEMTERATGRAARERLSTNENEFGPAPEVVRALAEGAVAAHRYPDCDHFALRSALGRELGVPAATVRVGSGVDGLLGEVCRAYLGPGRTAVTTEGTYPTFAYFARARGATVRSAPYRGARVDAEALAGLAREAGASLVYVAEPDNPTGGVLGRAAVLALADGLPPGTVLVLDGAYAEYQEPAERLRAQDVSGRPLVWLRTFSKAYGLAGMRVGYAVAARELLARLAQGAEHYVVGRLAEVGALAALEAPWHVARTVERTAQARADYTRRLGGLGYPVLPSAANFVTFRCPDPYAASALAEGLAERGILVRRLAVPGLSDHVRISVGPRRQRDGVLAALRARIAA